MVATVAVSRCTAELYSHRIAFDRSNFPPNLEAGIQECADVQRLTTKARNIVMLPAKWVHAWHNWLAG